MKKWIYGIIIVALLIASIFLVNQFSTVQTSRYENIISYGKSGAIGSISNDIYTSNLNEYPIGSKDSIRINWNNGIDKVNENPISSFDLTFREEQVTIYERQAQYTYYNNIADSDTAYFRDNQIKVMIGRTQCDGYSRCGSDDKLAELIIETNPNISIEILDKQVLQFETDSKTIQIQTNNLFIPVEGKLLVNINYERPDGTMDTITYDKDVIIPEGKEVFDFQIPLKVSGELEIQADVYYTLTNYGLRVGNVNNGDISLYVTGSQCKYNNGKHCFDDYNFDTLVGSDSYKTLVSPKPLWLELEGDACPVGYEEIERLDEEGNEEIYCQRADLKDLTCTILGCPIVEGHEYECTSAGICAETVYVFKDCRTDGCVIGECTETISEDTIGYVCIEEGEEIISTCKNNPNICPNGTVCDTNAEVCINEIISEKILQCKTSNDCLIPCQGITATCQENQCIYDGECQTQTLTCDELQCPQGTVCQNIEGKNVCIQEDTFSDMLIKLSIAVVLAGLVFGIVYIVFKKRK